MTLSFEEKTDALIALSIVFDRRSSQSDDPVKQRPVADVVRESLRSLKSLQRGDLDEGIAGIESLPDRRRQQWLGRWIDDIRRRGRSTKLDQHINAEQIAHVLKKEPDAIRRTIVSYLPPDLGRDVVRLIAPDLRLDSSNDDFASDLPTDILEIVKRAFISNFVQIESIPDANALDELSVDELQTFMRLIGFREIAVACRGIRSREKIAAFLCRFAEEDAKAIATDLSKLEDVEPIRVSMADRTIQRLWNRRLRPHLILQKIGLDLLACAYSERSDTAVRYTSRKLSYRDSRRWEKMIAAWKVRLMDPDTRMVSLERKRARAIVLMAGEFKENGSL